MTGGRSSWGTFGFMKSPGTPSGGRDNGGQDDMLPACFIGTKSPRRRNLTPREYNCAGDSSPRVPKVVEQPARDAFLHAVLQWVFCRHGARGGRWRTSARESFVLA